LIQFDAGQATRLDSKSLLGRPIAVTTVATTLPLTFKLIQLSGAEANRIHLVHLLGLIVIYFIYKTC
jgi:hypothetical protein